MLFGQLKPDEPEHLQIDSQTGGHNLQVADNVYPISGGYRPIKAFSGISAALPSDFLGGSAFKASDSTIQFLAATATNLYRFSSALAWSSILGSLSAGRWFFTQFNDRAIATHGGAPIDIDLLGGTAASLAGTPPSSKYCTTVRDFVVLASGNTATWSGFQDRAQWTAGVNQSGSQPMLAGGPITGLAGGRQGLVFQRGQITKMTYFGPPTIWQWDVISPNIGCIAAGSITQVGELCFFLSDKGFQVTDGNQVRPIGEERIDREFLSSYSVTDLEGMYACSDPKAQIVTFVMPGKRFNYHITLDRWTTATHAVKAAFNGFTAGTTLEQLDAIYGNLDAMGTISLDDARFMGGDPQFLFVDTSNVVGTMTGSNLAASFETPFVELANGREARINKVRPITDATGNVSLDITSRWRLGETGTTNTYENMRDNGDIPCRVSGRAIRSRVTIAAGTTWSYMQGLDYEMIASGGLR